MPTGTGEVLLEGLMIGESQLLPADRGSHHWHSSMVELTIVVVIVETRLLKKQNPNCLVTHDYDSVFVSV